MCALAPTHNKKRRQLHGFFLHIFCKLLFCGTHIFFHPKTCLISMYTYKLLVKLLLSIEPFVGNIRDHASDFRSIYLYLYTSPVYVYTCCLARTLVDCSPNSLQSKMLLTRTFVNDAINQRTIFFIYQKNKLISTRIAVNIPTFQAWRHPN